MCTTIPTTVNPIQKVTFECNEVIKGRFLTLQVLSNLYIFLSEISINVQTPGKPVGSGDPLPERIYMPSLCTDAGDSYCDPNWTPFPNMNMGLMGYDMVNSDPLATGGDPAFRSQIFYAVSVDDEKRMSLSRGLSVIEMLECQSSMSSETVSTVTVSVLQ